MGRNTSEQSKYVKLFDTNQGQERYVSTDITDTVTVATIIVITQVFFFFQNSNPLNIL